MALRDAAWLIVRRLGTALDTLGPACDGLVESAALLSCLAIRLPTIVGDQGGTRRKDPNHESNKPKRASLPLRWPCLALPFALRQATQPTMAIENDNGSSASAVKSSGYELPW